MRIAYVCADRGVPLDGVKGASAHARGLIRAFEQRGDDVRVIASCPGEVAAHVVPMSPPGILDALVGCDNPRVARALGHVWTNVAVHDRLVEYLATWRPDVVYERYSPFAVAGAVVAARLRLPHVLEVNASLAEEGARYRRQALQDAAACLERMTFEAASLVLAVSRELQAQLVADGVDLRKVAVVPNGVDGDLFACNGDAADGLPRGRTVIGFVGSLKPWHGLEVLTEAFRRLESSRFHLVIIGDGPRASVVRSLIRERPDAVTWLPEVGHEMVARYLRATDIAVAPYPALDNFYFSPLKVLEYMATGRAVVASRIGQLIDLVDDAVTGLLVAPGDAGALARAIERLADDERLRAGLGRRAANVVRARHLWSHRAAAIVDLIKALMEQETTCVSNVGV